MRLAELISARKSGQLKIWIKKADFNSLRPKVYAITADDKKIYTQTDKPGNNAKQYGLIACLVLFFTITYYLLKNYERVLTGLKK